MIIPTTIVHADSIFTHGTALAVWSIALQGMKYAFDAAVGSMESPDATSTRRYRFWFKFLNRFAANIERAKLADRGKNGPDDAAR